MTANFPVLPVAGSAVLRASLALVALVAHWLSKWAQARRHRREARILVGLDRHLLADMGINRADVRDAFSMPFWEDPTAILRERALERRIYGARATQQLMRVGQDSARRPPLDRPARHTI